MARNFHYACILLLFVSIFFVIPVTADFNTISAGNTVFIGEEGLDISGALNGATQMGWWASGASITTSSPDYVYPVPTPTNFAVSPGVFASRTGPWYRLDNSLRATGSALTVTDPQLNIRVEDTTNSVDVTNRWVPTGDRVVFRIETNLVDLSQRGSGSAKITIKVQSPDGAVYSSLADTGATNSIENISVSSSPFTTAFGWDTGNHNYPTGTYAIWAECNLNHMKDNYGVVGKTISQQISLLNQDQNPLIGANVPTTSPTTIQMTTLPVSISPTSLPQTTLPPTSQPTPVPTTVVPTVTTSPTPTVPVATAATIPLQTKSPGFEYSLAFVAGLIAFGLYSRQK